MYFSFHVSKDENSKRLNPHCPYVAWLTEASPLRAWVCQTHWLHGDAPVSRSEWTRGWRMGPGGSAPDGGINVYCGSAPSERALDTKASPPHSIWLMSGQLPLCSVTTLWLWVQSTRLSVDVIYCLSESPS